MARENRKATPLQRRRRAAMHEALRASARVDVIGSRDNVTPGTSGSSSLSRMWQREAWGYYDCLDAETEILTIDGWKSHHEIEIGSIVRTLDAERGTAQWEPVEDVRRFEVHDETMFRSESQRFSTVATGHHRWPVMHYLWDKGWNRRTGSEPRWTTSAEFSLSEDRIRTAAPAADLPTNPKWSDGLVEAVAWFWTEGTVRVSPRGTHRSASISQSSNVNPANVTRIRSALRRLCGDPQDLWQASRRNEPAWRETAPRADLAAFRLNSPLTALLEQHAPQKIVTLEFVRQLTAAQLELFIHISMLADGHLQRRTISQRDPSALDAFELALILSGRSPMRRTCRTTGKALLSYNEAELVSARTWDTIRYTGMIWCPKTPSQTWMARRRGTVYYTGNTVGELRYAARFIGACLSRCRLTLGLPDGRGNVGPVFDEEGEPLTDDNGKVLPGLERAGDALEVLSALRNPVGGQAQLLATMGLNLAIAGEFHLVGQRPEGTDIALDDVSALEWDVLSTEEFWRAGNNYMRRRMPGATPEEIPATDVHVIRIWRSHPRFSEQPDAMTQAVLDILEELVLLTREVRGEALSRLANGNLLLVPDEIEYPDDEADDAESDAGDPFTRDLLRSMSAAITDKGSAAQTAPFVVRAPGDQLHPDRFRTIDLSPKNVSDSAAKRKEAVIRFAQGIDLPVEIVVGHMSTTFANAVSIDDSLFKSHIEPILEIICDGLTAGYLRPALVGLGMADSPLVAHYDSTELVSRPNRAQDAKDLHDRYALSDATLRNAAGFGDSDAPDDEEIMQRIRIQQLIHVRQTVPTTPQGIEGEDVAVSSDIVPGMPPAPGAPLPQTPGPNNTDKTLAAALAAMTEVAVEQAVARAGGRLRSWADAKQPSLREQLSQVPAAEVGVTLGPQLVKRLSGDSDLFHGQFDILWSLAARQTGDQNYADALRAAATEIAAERLYQPRRPFPFARLPRYSERGVLSAAVGE